MQSAAALTDPSYRPASDRLVWWILAVTGMVKLVLAAVIPFTGDEAYFVVWARHLDYGYYDHGPVTGWLLALPLWLDHAIWLVRLPAVLISQAVGLILWRFLRPLNREAAVWVAILFLVSPASFVSGILVTTDTPLLLFTVLAAVFAWRAHRHDRATDYLLCGLWLGLAFLSKYFAVLFGLALAVAWLGTLGRARIVGLLLVLAGVLPSAAINIVWNYQHSWANILFNAFTRQSDSGFALENPVLFLALTFYLITPMVVYAVLRRRNRNRVPWREAWATMRATGVDLFAVLAGVPLLVFLLVSLTHSIGLHWVFSFLPLVFPVLGACLNQAGLRRLLTPLAWFTGIHMLLMFVITLLPVELGSWHRSYFKIVFSSHPDEVIAALEPYRDGYQLATPSYSTSALFEFFLQEDIPVLGSQSYHGRQDDFLTDFRGFDGKDILIVSDHERRFAEASRWFAESEVHILEVRGANFFAFQGRGFDYETYRERQLKPAKRFYDLPPVLQWLPHRCPFCEKYDLEHATVD